MNIASNILSDKFFRLAVGFAKSVAIDRKDEKLTPLTLLAGLLIAARHKAQDESAKPVLNEQDKIDCPRCFDDGHRDSKTRWFYGWVQLCHIVYKNLCDSYCVTLEYYRK